jgi:hypothetical protein
VLLTEMQPPPTRVLYVQHDAGRPQCTSAQPECNATTVSANDLACDLVALVIDVQLLETNIARSPPAPPSRLSFAISTSNRGLSGMSCELSALIMTWETWSVDDRCA